MTDHFVNGPSIQVLSRSPALSPGIKVIARYQTDDGAVHDTVEQAEAHIKALATRAWRTGLGHFLARLIGPCTVVSEGDIGRIADALAGNNKELAKILLEKPK